MTALIHQVEGEATLVPVPTGPLDRNPAEVYLRSLAGEGGRTMRSALNAVAEILGFSPILDTDDTDVRYRYVPWATLRYQHLQALRARLLDMTALPEDPGDAVDVIPVDAPAWFRRRAPATANKYLNAVRRVLRECFKLELMSSDDYLRATQIDLIKDDPLPPGRMLEEEEVLALITVCAADPTPRGRRDQAIIALLAATGLRRSEIVNLNLADYAPNRKHALTVRGKGRKQRTMYVSKNARPALQAWIDIRGLHDGPLFLSMRKGGKIQNRRLDAEAILQILKERAQVAGISERFSPHDLRRTFVSNLLDANVDLSTAQKLAGHASVTTTTKYDRRGERAKQDAVERVFVPDIAPATAPLPRRR